MENLVQTDTGDYFMYNSLTDSYEYVTVEEPHENTNEITEPELVNNPVLKKSNVWDRAQTLLLIQKYSQRKQELSNPRLKKMEIYKEIATELQNFGHNFTYEQCINRMKSLLAKYKEVKDHNNKSGNSCKIWEYFDIMETYMGDRPGIMPIAPCSSLLLSQTKNNAPSEACSSGQQQVRNVPKSHLTKLCTSDRDESSEQENPSKKRKNSPRVEMLKWVKDYKEESKAREDKKLELAKKQHEENKEILNEILHMLKK